MGLSGGNPCFDFMTLVGIPVRGQDWINHHECGRNGTLEMHGRSTIDAVKSLVRDSNAGEIPIKRAFVVCCRCEGSIPSRNTAGRRICAHGSGEILLESGSFKSLDAVFLHFCQEIVVARGLRERGNRVYVLAHQPVVKIFGCTFQAALLAFQKLKQIVRSMMHFLRCGIKACGIT